MLKLLIKKEFKLYFNKLDGKSGFVDKLISFLCLALIISVFTYVFSGIVGGFTKMGLSYQLLTVGVTCIGLIQIALGLPKVSSVLFLSADNNICMALPISNKQVVISKFIVLFVNQCLANTVILLPLCISYGVITSANTLFYFGIILLIVFFSLFTLSVDMLLSRLFIKIRLFFAKHRILYIASTLICLGALFFVYVKILYLFNDILLDSGLKYLFTYENGQLLTTLSKFFIPFNLLVNIILGQKLLSLFALLAIPALTFLGGYYVYKIYSKTLLTTQTTAQTKENLNVTVPANKSVTLTLMKKELGAIFSSNGSTSYIINVFSLPILICSTAKVINTIISTLFGSLFAPYFTLAIFLLYITLASSSAGSCLSREKKAIQNLKTMPISYIKQINIKLLVSAIPNVIAIIITTFGLMIFNNFSFLLAISQSGVVILYYIIVSVAQVEKDISSPSLDGRNTASNGVMLLSFLGSLVVLGLAIFSAFMQVKLVYLLLIGLVGLVAILSYGLLCYKANRLIEKIGL
ncbi:MAG: hypothetical protein RR248_01425 [Clostridia bacterium]